MIAVDAGELSFIRAWRHKLPTFRRLLDEGTLLKLQSSAEYVTGSVWPTMYTGKSPGEHGITQHIQWDPLAMRMRRVTSDWIYNEPFWYDLSRAGLGVVVIDVPFLFESRLPDAIGNQLGDLMTCWESSMRTYPRFAERFAAASVVTRWGTRFR